MINASLMSIKKLWLILFLNNWLYGVSLYIVLNRAEQDEAINIPYLPFISIIVTIGLLIASQLIFNNWLKDEVSKIKRDNNKIDQLTETQVAEHLRHPFIIKIAIISAICFFGCMASVLTKNTNYYLVMATISTIFYLINFPKIETMKSELIKQGV